MSSEICINLIEPVLCNSKFLCEEFHNKVLRFDKNTSTLVSVEEKPTTTNNQQFESDEQYIYFIPKTDQLLNKKELYKIIDNVPNGDEGDRVIRQKNIESIWKMDELLSEQIPELVVCAGVILLIGTTEDNESKMANLKSKLYFCCKTLRKE